MTTLQQRDPQAAAGTAGSVRGEFAVKARSQRQQIVRRFVRNKRAMGALILYAAVVIASFVGPHFYRWGYLDLDGTALSRPPLTPGHPLGTIDIGQDLLAQLMRGVQRSTLIALIYIGLALVIGVIVGAVSGYFGGWLDSILMRIVDLILTIPLLVILLVLASKFAGSGTAVNIALVLGAFGWMDLARILRSQFLTLREREFVEAAHAMGASDRRIIFKHLIPNSLGQIIVWITLGAATSVVLEASLTYLGFGVNNDISLGRLVSDGVSAADSRPWLFYIPGLVLMVIVLLMNFIGDGVRDAFDPSHSRVRA
ncbi:MAG: ABC transporter permease [Actinobacteria bacterium]|nr:ABC transporter permease [Actinomycetota bacterium]MBI3688000.1 ABC transporter permease [Actinomycetota bacterium]